MDIGTVWLITLTIVGVFTLASIYFGVWYIDNTQWNVAYLREKIQKTIDVIEADEYGDCHDLALHHLYKALEKKRGEQ